jgi:isopenicillin-N epimerase
MHPSSTAAVATSDWLLAPQTTFLNHGSFGSCPRAVLDCARSWQERLERQPVQFLYRELEGLIDQARGILAAFLGAQAEDLVFVSNATTGVNTILQAQPWAPGDELLLTNHEYNACRNAAEFVVQRAGARVVVAEVPFPLQSEDELVAAILARVTPRTRLVLLDHVTSPTALIFPIQRLVRELAARGVETLVDGAHGPGMVPLDLDRLGAAYYTGNCHKWLCAPKGAAFLHVRRDRQAHVRPLVISHGANSPRTDRSRFLIEFGWTGTLDPAPVLSVPEALRVVGAMVPGGWPEVRRRNHELAVAGRQLLCAALELAPPCPAAMLGATAALPLPDATADEPLQLPLLQDPLAAELLGAHRIEVPVFPWPTWPKRLLRISAQLYNRPEHYAALAAALQQLRGWGRH